MRVRATLVLAVVLPAASARALTAVDCQRWMAELGGETASLPLPRPERDALLRELRTVTPGARAPSLADTIDDVTKFQARAAALARQGKVSPTEGERLHTLSETVRRCFERVRAGD
jgi:hypothetical protein